MTRQSKQAIRALALVALFGLAAGCNGNRLGTTADQADTTADAAEVHSSALADPQTPAYFNEVVGDRVFFEVDDATLGREAQQVLNTQAQWLLDNPDYEAIIEGHADERGTREYNLALGARRANAVQEYLVLRGVAGLRLRVVSYGKERPIALCSTEVCYTQNRRAVTVLSLSPSS